MKFGILGTGIVGLTISARLDGLGHEVILGTRDVKATLARTEPGFYGIPPFAVWQEEHPRIRLESFAEVAAFGEMVFNCTEGGASLEALKLAGERNLHGKVLIDIANPLDFSRGMPPTMLVCNTDSLGEQIQRTFPDVKVVKTLNTMNAQVMVNPALISGDHDVFVSGNDAQAKARVTDLLKNEFGWKSVIDLGDITTARGVEMYLPLWIHLFGSLQNPIFNVKIVR
jgi:predicted dinucleotide-binding enzyme